MQLLPMNRLYDELIQVEQHRKQRVANFTIIKQDNCLFENDEQEFNLSLLLEEARSKSINFHIELISKK